LNRLPPSGQESSTITMDGGCGGIPSPCLDFLKTPTMYHRTASETIDSVNPTITIGSQDGFPQRNIEKPALCVAVNVLIAHCRSCAEMEICIADYFRFHNPIGHSSKAQHSASIFTQRHPTCPMLPAQIASITFSLRVFS
jgi:hypothetical protein